MIGKITGLKLLSSCLKKITTKEEITVAIFANLTAMIINKTIKTIDQLEMGSVDMELIGQLFSPVLPSFLLLCGLSLCALLFLVTKLQNKIAR